MKTLFAALALALACAAMARPAHPQAPRAHLEKSDAGYDDEEDRT